MMEGANSTMTYLVYDILGTFINVTTYPNTMITNINK
jgi:hypothetical protein